MTEQLPVSMTTPLRDQEFAEIFLRYASGGRPMGDINASENPGLGRQCVLS